MLEHPGSVGILCRNTNERLAYYVGTPRSGWYIMSEHLGADSILLSRCENFISTDFKSKVNVSKV